MRHPRFLIAALAAAPLLAAGAAAAQQLSTVASANPKLAGVSLPTLLSPELVGVVRAQGSMRVENPTASVSFYGYLNDQPNMVPVPGTTSNVEAGKTEPDKNTYLVLAGQKGADPAYDYGSHFLFQGHEAGSPGTLTRINLDADAAHRITVLANFDRNGAPLPTVDGSTWYPWAARLLLTQEGNGNTSGGVWQATADYPSVVENLLGVMGRGGFEGVQADGDGNVWLVEDIGGASVGGAKLPNSFIYRFTPKNRADLRQGGRMQALQVMSRSSPGQPIAYQAASALTQDILDLHTAGASFDTRWVTVHDTDVDGFAPFNANALAKARGATPFKRPENGVFRPGMGFREFFFDETGDTNATSTANAAHGGWGSLMRLAQASPSAATGKLSLFVNGDLQHTGFDNIQFWDEHRVLVVEDRGDGLHSQGNALDSGWLYDTRLNYASGAHQPVRVIAQGRDVSATIDSALSGTPGFQNDGDNEITGIHVSDGDPTPEGVLGHKRPRPFRDGWRVFYTQQHGDNVTWELLPRDRRLHERDDER
ncbi:MAG TPA: alkaline phosphatase PhoX [Albitalea sp.]|nr:alkaline phosphatase PhoX [Albitalea sp.]